VIVDLGTGDGRAVLARAAADPDTLVIGVDASAAAMAEASRKAERRHLDNVRFLAAGVEALPRSPLAGVADLVTVSFPWGSLLRGVVGLDDAALDGIAAPLGPGARLEALVSVRPADGLADVTAIDESRGPAIATAWRRAGIDLVAMRPASGAEVAASGSSWGRRLGAGDGRAGGRTAWRLEGVARHAAERAG
jgi:16S rRNA (adenine(1408)-N(1))-methyltransferase